MTKLINTASGWYANVFKGWPVKLVGPQPTDAQLSIIHNLGARPGKQALANAMALRDGGVTGSQIQIACGAPQLNKMRGFVTDGLMKFVAVPPADNNHKVYKLVVTAKGQARIDKAVKAAELAALNGDAETAPKAPKKAKAKKATVEAPAAETVTSEAPTANEGHVTHDAPAETQQASA